MCRLSDWAKPDENNAVIYFDKPINLTAMKRLEKNQNTFSFRVDARVIHFLFDY